MDKYLGGLDRRDNDEIIGRFGGGARIRVLRRRLFLCLAVALGVHTGQARAVVLTPEMEELYTSLEISPPTAERMTVCYGFSCRRRMLLAFTEAERRHLTGILAKGRASPVEERKAIQQAFVWFDIRVGNETGTSKRLPHADIRTLDAAHNFDCWDTTRNAQSLLLVFQEWGALRHHRVGNPRYRGNIFFGQLPHNTAVIAETAGGTQWIVDMWTTKYGQVPDVMTLEKWLADN
jgi:hypothetical protein